MPDNPSSAGYVWANTDCACPDDTGGGGTDPTAPEKEVCICDVVIPDGYPNPSTLQIIAACMKFILACLCELGCLSRPQENYVITEYTGTTIDLASYFDPTESKVQYDILWNGRRLYEENNDYTVAGSVVTWTLPKEDCVIEIVVRRYKDLKIGCA